MSHILSVSYRRRKCQAYIHSSALLIVHPFYQRFHLAFPIPSRKCFIWKVWDSQPWPHNFEAWKITFRTRNASPRPAARSFSFLRNCKCQAERARVKLDRGRRRSVVRSVGSDVLSASVQEEKAFWRKIVAARPTCQTHSRFSSRWVQHF